MGSSRFEAGLDRMLIESGFAVQLPNQRFGWIDPWSEEGQLVDDN